MNRSDRRAAALRYRLRYIYISVPGVGGEERKVRSFSTAS